MKSGIDLLRHILAICVIIQHMTSSRYSYATNESLHFIADFIDGAVACFFLISGYLSKTDAAPIKSIKKKSIRLLIPFLMFSIAYSILLAALDKDTLENGLIKTITLQGAGMQLYFLPYLFLISSVFCLFQYITSNISWRISSGSVAVTLTIFCLFTSTTSSTDSDFKLIPFYTLAYFLGSMYCYFPKRFFLSIVISISLLLGFYDKRFFDLSGIVALFTVAELLSSHLRECRLPGSGGVYLLHTPITNFSISIELSKLGISEFPNAATSVIITYITCLLISLCTISYLKKFRWLMLE